MSNCLTCRYCRHEIDSYRPKCARPATIIYKEDLLTCKIIKKLPYCLDIKEKYCPNGIFWERQTVSRFVINKLKINPPVTFIAFFILLFISAFLIQWILK